MRIVQQLTVSKDEIKVSPLDMVSRAKHSLFEGFGEELFQAYPTLVEVDETSIGSIVSMDMVVFTSKEFHGMVNDLMVNLTRESDVQKVIKAFNLKELK